MPVRTWLGGPARHPKQPFALNEADAEIVALDDGRFLATTTDGISEELAIGLYRDPHTMGWMAAQASLSDLAAVGAVPTGLLFSAHWAPGATVGFKREVARGFTEAAASAGTFLLGGDTGSAAATVLHGVGVGFCERRPPGRAGMKPGDLLCVTGKTGGGPALAFSLLLGEKPSDGAFAEALYRPRARLEEGRVLAGFATAMMDTSDGLLSTIDTLKTLSGVGVELEWNTDSLDARAVEYCGARGIPHWLLWVGEHGDFELVCAVPPSKFAEAKARVPGLHVIGRAVENAVTSTVRIDGSVTRCVDFSMSRQLSSERSLDPASLHDVFNRLIQASRVGGLP